MTFASLGCLGPNLQHLEVCLCFLPRLTQQKLETLHLTKASQTQPGGKDQTDSMATRASAINTIVGQAKGNAIVSPSICHEVMGRQWKQ